MTKYSLTHTKIWWMVFPGESHFLIYELQKYLFLCFSCQLLGYFTFTLYKIEKISRHLQHAVYLRIWLSETVDVETPLCFFLVKAIPWNLTWRWWFSSWKLHMTPFCFISDWWIFLHTWMVVSRKISVTNMLY